MKVLAYRFSAFGDVAMLVPVLKEFLEQNPEAEVVMVSRSNFGALFENIDRLTFKGIELENYSNVLGLTKLAWQLKQQYQPDRIADFHNVLRTKLLSLIFRFLGLKVAVLDKGRKEKKLLTQKDKVLKRLTPTTERYAEVLRNLGFKVTLSHQLPVNSEKKSGVGFAPFAQHEGKMLPLEKSYELLKVLAQEKEVFLFGGGPKETAVLNEWSKALDHVTSLAGKLTLTEELKKIAQLEVMISMDSANMHLASLVGTRCISVWGSTHHFAGFLGYGQSEKDMVSVEDLSCRPCSVFGNQPCYRGDYACLQGINIQNILEKI